MADRRSDDTPLVPHRSLGGRAQAGEESSDTARQPLSERVSSAVSSAGGSRTTRSAEGSRTDEALRPSSTPTGSTNSVPATAVTSRAPARSGRPKKARRARLRLTHVDPWSVMKTAFLLSIAFGIVTVVAVALVWSVLGAAGVWDSINATVQDVLGDESSGTFDVESYVGTSRVMGFTMIVAVVDVILITAVATLAAFLYNLSAALLGGIDVTLAEDER